MKKLLLFVYKELEDQKNVFIKLLIGALLVLVGFSIKAFFPEVGFKLAIEWTFVLFAAAALYVATRELKDYVPEYLKTNEVYVVMAMWNITIASLTAFVIFSGTEYRRPVTYLVLLAHTKGVGNVALLWKAIKSGKKS